MKCVMDDALVATQLLEQARKLCAKGQLDDALSMVDRALALDSEQSSIWREWGDLISLRLEFAEAMTAYTHALALDPNDGIAWSGKGAALEHLGRIDEALRAVERKAALDPDEARAWITWLAIARQQGQHQTILANADEELQHPQSSGSVDVLALLTKCTVLYDLQRYDDAIQLADRALGHAPKNAWAWNIRAIASCYLHRYTEALAAIEQALALRPDVSFYWANKGNILIY